jgi:hypothetical protein
MSNTKEIILTLSEEQFETLGFALNDAVNMQQFYQNYNIAGAYSSLLGRFLMQKFQQSRCLESLKRKNLVPCPLS